MLRFSLLLISCLNLLFAQTNSLFQLVYKHELMGLNSIYECKELLDIPSSDTLVKNTSHLLFYSELSSSYRCTSDCFKCITEVTPKPDKDGNVEGVFYYIAERKVECYPLLSLNDYCYDTVILVMGYLTNGKRHGFVMENKFSTFIGFGDRSPCITELYLYSNGIKHKEHLIFKTKYQKEGLYSFFQLISDNTELFKPKRYGDQLQQIYLNVK